MTCLEKKIIFRDINVTRHYCRSLLTKMFSKNEKTRVSIPYKNMRQTIVTYSGPKRFMVPGRPYSGPYVVQSIVSLCHILQNLLSKMCYFIRLVSGKFIQIILITAMVEFVYH